MTVRLTPDQVKQRQDFAIQQNITTLRNRVDELGVTEPIVARQGVDRITVQLPGVQDPNEALRVLGATATLEFRLVDDQNDADRGRATRPRAARLASLPDAPGWPGAAQARHHRLGRAAGGRELGILRGAAGRVREARCPRRRRDARDDPRRTSAGRWRWCTSRRSGSRRTSPASGVRTGTECTEEEVISVATIQGVFSSNFQITGLLAGEAQRACAAAARRVARGAALHRRAAHRGPEPRPGQRRHAASRRCSSA